MILHILKLIWNKKASNALMVLEIFLAFLVLYFALTYVFFNLEKTSAPLGFETVDKWMVRLDDLSKLDSVELKTTLASLESNLQAKEEIKDLSYTKDISPFQGNTWSSGGDQNGFNFHCFVVPCDERLASTLDMSMNEGRWFEEEDHQAAIQPIIMNQAFMDKYYADQSMIDSNFIFHDETYKIIGTAEAYKFRGEFEEDYPTIMMLFDPKEKYSNVILKMQNGTPASFEEELSKVVNGTTKKTGNIIVNLEKERIANSREQWMLFVAILFICGFLCVNVVLGLFGVLWYNINKRKSEIGLRQALGAYGFDITKQFIMEVMLLSVIALLFGIFFAIQVPLLELTEFPKEMFYKAILYSSLIILTLVFVCALFPSFQASKITPASSLHED